MQFLLHNFNYILKLKFAYICPSVCLAICLSIWRHFSSSLINVRSNNKLELPLPGKVKRYEQEVFFLLKNYSNYQKHCKRIRKKILHSKFACEQNPVSQHFFVQTSKIYFQHNYEILCLPEHCGNHNR